MRRLALAFVIGAAAVAALAGGATAAANAPCRDRIYNEWYANGKIAATFPLACYRSALAHLDASADLSVYSSLGDDIRLALAAAVRRERASAKTTTAPADPPPTTTLPAKPATTTLPAHSRVHQVSQTRTAPLRRAPATADRSAETAAATTSRASSGGVPTTLLVLAGIALALVAAGGVGVAIRQARGRR